MKKGDKVVVLDTKGVYGFKVGEVVTCVGEANYSFDGLRKKFEAPYGLTQWLLEKQYRPVKEGESLYKFVGTKKDRKEYDKPRPKIGAIYEGSWEFQGCTVSYYAISVKDEWELVEGKSADDVINEIRTNILVNESKRIENEAVEQESYYKYVGTPEQANEYVEGIKPEIGRIYKGTDLMGWLADVNYCFELLPEEWEKVTVWDSFKQALSDISKKASGTFTSNESKLSYRRAGDVSFEGVYVPTKSDEVNHPDHYTSGEVECKDAIASAVINKTGYEAVCVGNVIKYLWRYENKGGLTDIKKAKFYLDELIKTKDGS